MCFKENYCMIQQGSFILFYHQRYADLNGFVDRNQQWHGSEVLKQHKVRRKNKQTNPTPFPLICLESLNVFASKMIKGLFVLFPSAKSNCGFIGFDSWENVGNVS